MGALTERVARGMVQHATDGSIDGRGTSPSDSSCRRRSPIVLSIIEMAANAVGQRVVRRWQNGVELKVWWGGPDRVMRVPRLIRVT